MDDEMSIEDMMWTDYDYQVNTGELDFIDFEEDTEEELDYEEDPD